MATRTLISFNKKKDEEDPSPLDYEIPSKVRSKHEAYLEQHR